MPLCAPAAPLQEFLEKALLLCPVIRYYARGLRARIGRINARRRCGDRLRLHLLQHPLRHRVTRPAGHLGGKVDFFPFRMERRFPQRVEAFEIILDEALNAAMTIRMTVPS